MLWSMFDARGRGSGTSATAQELGPDVLAAARQIGRRARVGLLPMHADLAVLPVARQLVQAFEILGDSVTILDTEAPWLTQRSEAGVVPPAVLERALEDACARARRVLVAFSAGDLEGPAASLFAALDGILLLARPGGSSEFRLHKLLRHIDGKRALGVLLVE